MTPATRRILVVDDDRDTRETLVEVLESEGYEVEEAANGVDALVAVGRRRPDLVLLDSMMPGPSGFQVAEWLRAHPDTREIEVVLMGATHRGRTGWVERLRNLLSGSGRPDSGEADTFRPDAPSPDSMSAEERAAFQKARAVVGALAPLRIILETCPALNTARRRELLREHAPFAFWLLDGRGDEAELLALLSARGGAEVVAARVCGTPDYPEQILLNALRAAGD